MLFNVDRLSCKSKLQIAAVPQKSINFLLCVCVCVLIWAYLGMCVTACMLVQPPAFFL